MNGVPLFRNLADGNQPLREILPILFRGHQRRRPCQRRVNRFPHRPHPLTGATLAPWTVPGLLCRLERDGEGYSSRPVTDVTGASTGAAMDTTDRNVRSRSARTDRVVRHVSDHTGKKAAQGRLIVRVSAGNVSDGMMRTCCLK
jgi:hypothetical protein